MSEDDYAFLRDFVRRRSGLSLGPEKHYLIDSRLAPVARAAGLDGLGALVMALRLRRDKALASAVADAMATHETLFFRDRQTFQDLRETVLPALAGRSTGAPLRIWSAAASTGQEAYSIAMTVSDLGSALRGRRVEIVASDMAASVVERASTGLYSQFEVQRGLPVLSLLRHFVQTEAGWQVSRELRAMVECRVFNLLDDPRSLGQFDIIFCRNLLIYLDGPTKRALLDRLAKALAPGGHLCLGSAETSVGLSQALQPAEDARCFFVAAAPRGLVVPPPDHAVAAWA